LKGNIALDLEVAAESARNVEIRKVPKGASDRYLEAIRRHIQVTRARGCRRQDGRSVDVGNHHNSGRPEVLEELVEPA
jgi:hypothetical protein